MKKNAAALLLTMAFVLSLAACGGTAPASTEAPVTAAPETEAPAIAAGTYTSVKQGRESDVTVTATFSESALTSVTIDASGETWGIGWGLDCTPAEFLAEEAVAKQAVSLDGVTGATLTSAAIRLGIADCAEQAGADAILTGTAGAESTAGTYEADVVVVGAGAAGLAAGITAQENGADVVILEAQGVTGGATVRSGGKFIAGGSKFQDEQGITGDSPEALFEYFKSIGGDYLNDEKVMNFCENANDIIDWLEGMGTEFTTVEPIHSSITPWRVINTKGGGGQTSGLGGNFTVPMTDAFLNNGGTLLMNSSAYELITDDSGAVIGVKATDCDGGEIVVNADAVVIATGDYSQNHEMTAQYVVADNYITGVPTPCDGTGAKMAMAVGADFYQADSIMTCFCSFTCGAGVNEESGLIVNNVGERVANEWTYFFHVGEELMNSGSNIGYYICDANDPNPTVQYGMTLESTPSSDTIEGLAELIGMDPDMLKETVDRYNELCRKGTDDDFGKASDYMVELTGPTYYALLLNPNVSLTYGGLVTDIDAHVLTPDGSVIPGLYAAGVVANTGLFGTEYPCCGMAIGSSICYGRIAGENAALEG